jgi:DNA repair protein RecO (recombination protein O)
VSVKSTEAISLRSYPYRESDRIVVFFTRADGKVRGIARGARLLKSRFGSALEPMSYIRLIYFEKENQELAFINSCDLLESHSAHRNTLEGSYYCAYFSELLSEISQEGEANDKLFRLLLEVLRLSPPLAWRVRARYLEVWLLRLEGVFPSLQRCDGCGRALGEESVHIASGGQSALCRSCSSPGDFVLGLEERELVLDIFARRISAIDWARWSGQALKNLGALNSKLLQYHLGKLLKSNRFLQELERC